MFKSRYLRRQRLFHVYFNLDLGSNQYTVAANKNVLQVYVSLFYLSSYKDKPNVDAMDKIVIVGV